MNSSVGNTNTYALTMNNNLFPANIAGCYTGPEFGSSVRTRRTYIRPRITVKFSISVTGIVVFAYSRTLKSNRQVRSRPSEQPQCRPSTSVAKEDFVNLITQTAYTVVQIF